MVAFTFDGAKPGQVTPAHDITELLHSLDAGCSRDDWVKIGMAYHNEGGQFADFDGWSSTADNYEPIAARDVWRSFKPGKGLGIGTLIKLAKDSGWRNDDAPHRITPAPRKAEPARKPAPGMCALEVWNRCEPATIQHAYIAAKRAQGVPMEGLRVVPRGDALRINGQDMAGYLVVPAYLDGVLQTAQFIPPPGAGKKLNLPGSSMAGCSFTVGAGDGPVYLAEGVGAAWAVWQATGRRAVVCFGWGNVRRVAEAMRERDSSARLVLVPDVGKELEAAKIAADVSAAVVCMPEGWANNSDINDLMQAEGTDVVAALLDAATEPLVKNDWLIPADDFCAQPSPISWLVKGWLQGQALIMVHGPSGGGKTFVVLDWCLRIASGMPDWIGRKVKTGNVVYLAGEGHHGLRGRIAAWKHHNGAGRLSMWLSKDGCDLNTVEGYQRVTYAIKQGGISPSVIVVDTLHRFLSGDENSAQDAKTMLDACNALMIKFGCSVILVHHTGVSDEAQHRARGSSAWRGALDIEISIVPSKNDGPIEIVQRKSKDAEIAETVFVELHQVAIPDWYDEDGKPVTSAVIVEASAPVKADKKDNKVEAHRKTFECSWWASGVEDRNGSPYVSRSGMINYLVTDLALSEASAKQYIKPSVPGKLIADLLTAQIIEPHENGWVVIDADWASVLMIRKDGKG